MKIFLTLSFLLMLFVVSCSTDSKSESLSTSVALRTANKQLQINFDSCLHLTQRLIRTQTSDKEFSQFFRFDKRATGFEYENVVYSVLDTLSQIPKSYQICYDFIFKGDTLGSFEADFDSNLKVYNYRNFHLTAFRKFIDNKLTVTKSKATDIAVRNGMKRKGLDPILICSADKIYWDCKNDCDGCVYFEIDAEAGHIIGRGMVIYQY